MYREIPIYEIENIKIGNAQNKEARTGCTVILCPQGAPTGIDVRGGGPASRESELLRPVAACEAIHAVLLSGGSAFGLDAAGGVMRYLEERGVGFQVGDIRVPLVCQSCIFDLGIGDPRIRPDAAMAYAACVDAETNRPHSGDVGCGCGATVGKLRGMENSAKSGLGMYAVQLGSLKVGAVVCVNALGDVYDHRTGKKLAGMAIHPADPFRDSEEAMYHFFFSADQAPLPQGNTTIGAIITNAAFGKTPMNKIAAMAQDAYSRCIRPIHTTADGDTVYAMSVGHIQADINLVGTLAAHVMAEAICRAVLPKTENA